MRVGLIIVAAGSGTRLGAVAPKAFVPLAGVPLLGHALRGALSCADVAEVVVVAPAGWVTHADAVCRSAGSRTPVTSAPPTSPSSEHSVHRDGDPPGSSEHSVHRDADPPGSSEHSVHRDADPPGLSEHTVQTSVVVGGAQRGDSVAAGLAALSADVDVVLVHDAARCLTPVAVFERVIAAVRGGAAAVVPGVVVVDTIKQVDAAGWVIGTPERAALRAIQTPQGFRRDVLERAHASSSDATDDAGLVERLGEGVIVVPGDERALKITTPADLETAARILAG